MTEPRQSTKGPIETPAPGLRLADVYYILFRQKWLIGAFFAAGLLAGTLIYFAQKRLYWSEAKLLVRYVVDTKSMEPGVGSQVQSPIYGGEAIINSELEILTSLDLCKEVAEAIGPENSNSIAAAIAISKGLTVDNPRHSNIIKVRFVHANPEMCGVILQKLVDAYLRRHVKLHRSASDNDSIRFLQDQANQLLTRIRQDEEEERKLKLRQQLFEAEAQLAEYRSSSLRLDSGGKGEKDASAGTNATPEMIAEYKMVSTRLEAVRARELELTIQRNYSDENPLVKQLRDQIDQYEKRKAALEAQNPKLATLYLPRTTSSSAEDNRSQVARALAREALEAKIGILTNQLGLVYTNIAMLGRNVETDILDVHRKLEIERENYTHIATGLEAAQFDQALGEAKMSNIQQVQAPSPPAPDVSQRLKFVAIGFFGLFLGGVAFAFVIELFVKNTVRRSADLESKLHIPLFLSIPKLGLNGHAALLPLPSRSDAPHPSDAEAEPLRHTWAEEHPVRPYIDGLRDRTLIHFEGDAHKPKLIGITSCSADVGVTSLAAGLAGALSETGEGNVLLLNLNFDSQSVHPFYRGELTCALTDVLETDKRRNSPVLHNLYVATAGSSTDSEAQNLSKQLARVVPKLRVSDYDYIIFDLPPTTPTTMTAPFGGMMGFVFF